MPIPILISISTEIDNSNKGISVLFKSIWIENIFLDADANVDSDSDSEVSELFLG